MGGVEGGGVAYDLEVFVFFGIWGGLCVSVIVYTGLRPDFNLLLLAKLSTQGVKDGKMLDKKVRRNSP